ncbi:MAPEG family protein [Cyanobium gracile]|uniref:MAPEG family protein n=1 Tax=Cyanobium gracile UHCC 0281 TaxID=3110309 RepID=A0ABU5SZ12_9CYAN|nr:MAPEG family protein [Cyanobium gracile]MEA5443758.1 MAPEG family protein [Cyanobium gracile UHCC 0281]
MTTSLLSPVLAASIALPVLPAAAGGAFAWSLVLSAAMVVLSLVPLGAARSQADFKPSDLAAPRAMFERLPAWGKRANWAHQNSFESFTLHAPACLLCLVVTPAVLAVSPWLALAAWLHPLLRLGYLTAYVANIPPVRSLCWAGGILCTALLYSEGLRAVLRS